MTPRLLTALKNGAAQTRRDHQPREELADRPADVKPTPLSATAG
jgi:hypothetical protein